MTAKNIIDSITGIATRFSTSDESRVDPDFLYYKINQIAAALKVDQHIKTGKIPSSWILDMGLISFHKVNKADDPSITYCNCEVGKAFIPQMIEFISKDGSEDLGIYSLVSACGTTQYYPRRMFQWSYTPSDNVLSKFGYYARNNTSCYISNYKEKLKMIGCPVNPEDAKLVNSETVLSGAIESGVVYSVKFSGIIYNGTVYAANSTFTGVTGVTTFTGTGTVYLNSQVRAYRDTDAYPASPEMIRAIELEILTKEFGIEMKMLVDVRNDSKDDAVKSPS